MPQPGFNLVHIEEVLRNIAIGFEERTYIASRAVPEVTVQDNSGKYFVYSAGDFLRSEVARRAPATPYATTGFKVSTDSYAVEQWALSQLIPDEVAEANDTPFDLLAQATENITRQLRLHIENEVASVVFNSASYPASNVVTLSGTQQWNDASSDPYGDVLTAKETVAGLIGVKPNKMIMGVQVYNELLRHPDILDRIKYTQTGIVTADLLARLFDVDELLVGEAMINTAKEGDADNITYIWGKHVALLYTPTQPGLMRPSFAYQFVWSPYNRRVSVVRDDKIDAVIVRIKHEFDVKVTGSSAGYLIQNAVA